MKYGITQLVSGCDTFVQISEVEFERIRTARESLFTVLSIEEKLEYVIENFRELELECLDIALDEITRWTSDWSRGIGNVHRVSRRIANFVATCRMYFDQVSQHVRELFGRDSNEVALLKKSRSEAYDSALSYRFLEALRNYVQHCDLAIHGLKMHTKRVDENATSSSVIHFVVPQVTLASIDRKHFKSSVLDEMIEANGATIDLRQPLREYIDAVGRIHLIVRGMYQTRVDVWESEMTVAIRRFRESSSDKDASFVYVVTATEDDNSIFDAFLVRRKELVAKNKQPIYFARRFVTGQLDE